MLCPNRAPGSPRHLDAVFAAFPGFVGRRAARPRCGRRLRGAVGCGLALRGSRHRAGQIGQLAGVGLGGRPVAAGRRGVESSAGSSACTGAPAPGAAVPVMKRFSRASTPEGGPEGRGSAVVRTGDAAARGRRAAPRCHGGASPASGLRPAWAGVARWTPARSTEPSPFRLSPLLGAPGSFGEVTPTPYVCTKAARGGGSRVCGRAESNCPSFGGSAACPLRYRASRPTPQRRRLSSTSSSAFSSALRAMANRVSPSPRFINRTPLVCRPALRTWRAAVRITPPPDVIA